MSINIHNAYNGKDANEGAYAYGKRCDAYNELAFSLHFYFCFFSFFFSFLKDNTLNYGSLRLRIFANAAVIYPICLW